MTGISLNIEGLTSKKIEYFKLRCATESIFSIGVCETWLNPDVEDDEVSIKGFEIYRSDRKSRIKGGVAIYVNQNFIVEKDSILKFSNSTCEVVAVYIPKENIALISIYRPPYTKLNLFQEALHEVESWLEQNCNDQTHSMVFGDFNFPFFKWGTYVHDDGSLSIIPTVKSGSSSSCQEQGSMLIELMDANYFSQRIADCTRKGKNTLELIYTNSDMVNDPVVIPNTISDHESIEYTLNICRPKAFCKKKFSCHSTENVTLNDFRLGSKDTDWNVINSSLKMHLEKVGQDLTVSELIDYFYECCLQAVAAGAPKKQRPKYFKGIPPDRKKLMKKRTKLRKQIEHSTNLRKKHCLRQNVLNIDREIMRSIDSEKLSAERKAIANAKNNPKVFFRYAKNRAGINNNIAYLRNDCGEIVDDPSEIPNILNKQYNNMFNKEVCYPHVVLNNSVPSNPNEIKLSDFFNRYDAPLTSVSFDVEKVCHAIDCIKSSSASGPDSVPPLLLKMTKLTVAKFLADLMTKSFQNNEIPDIFKLGIVIPIFKGGDKLEAKNYRPVSLTSHIIKLMERIIKTEIMNYLESNCLINGIQHGFRAGRSTVSDLLNHYHHIVDAFEAGDDLDTVMLDFSKAFDRVHHTVLLKKVKALGIDGPIGQWIGNFLIGRKQRVKVDDSLSDLSEVLSGVPQGSILGPLLFIIFINDINDNVDKSCVSCYADDSKVSLRISDEADRDLLQNDIETIFRWSEQNLLIFNEDKLEFMRFNRNSVFRKDHCYQGIAGHIKQVESSRDLGLYFDSNASFSTHITVKVSKAKKLCGYILRTFITRQSSPLIYFYKTVVLPVLEYCCIVWHPYKLNQIREIESIQRDFTSRMHDIQEFDYWDRLKLLNIFSLERRRERYIILYTFKIMFGLVPNPGICWFDSPRRGRLLQAPVLDNKHRYGQTLKYHSFFCVSSRIFNCLPKDIRNMNCKMEQVKQNLDRFLRKVPDEPRLSGYTCYSRSASNSIQDQVMFML